MKDTINDIRDDEIRVIGEEQQPKYKGWKWLLLFLAGLIIGGILWWILAETHEKMPEALPEPPIESGYFEPMPDLQETQEVKPPLSRDAIDGVSYIEMMDTTINDIPIRLYIPHRMRYSLHVGTIDRQDPSILFAAQAADVRADNGGIVGAFVLKGEPKAWGLSKKGYCAIIHDTVTVGVADNSPLFEEATEKEGYFFRQFPLVDNGRLVENEPRGKAIRRALCDRGGELFTVETLSYESFYDFSQALVDLGVDNAIYLVGAKAYGWATDADGVRHEFGDPAPPKKKWKNISYLVMKAAE